MKTFDAMITNISLNEGPEGLVIYSFSKTNRIDHYRCSSNIALQHGILPATAWRCTCYSMALYLLLHVVVPATAQYRTY